MPQYPKSGRQRSTRLICGWFEKPGDVMAGGGAELQGPETATTVKYGPNGGEPVVVDGILLGEGECRRVQNHRRSRPRCRDRHRPVPRLADLDAVTDDPAAAVLAHRREKVDRALEAVEHVPVAGGHHLERLS
jgi:hypothetical protein